MLDWTQLRILIVEDEPQLREVIQMLVENKGATVLVAEDGLKAIEILAKEKVDVVISDVQMPVLNGLELLRHIRQKDKDYPIVFLATGYADISEELATQNGAAGLVHKPFRTRELFKALEGHLIAKFPHAVKLPAAS